DRAELGEVLCGNFGDAAADGLGRRWRGTRALEKRDDILLGDPALLARPFQLGEVDAELAGYAAHRGARMQVAKRGRGSRWRPRESGAARESRAALREAE